MDTIVNNLLVNIDALLKQLTAMKRRTSKYINSHRSKSASERRKLNRRRNSMRAQHARAKGLL